MTVKSFYVQNMLRKYGKQIASAQQLVRASRSARNLHGLTHNELIQISDEDQKIAEERRNTYVERVAREVYENLLFSGSDNPVVHEIKAQLEHELGFSVLFKNPSPNLSLQIYRDSEIGPVKVSHDEKNEIMDKLWAISLDKVNETML
ncbi:MAG: hypothetical protein MI749_17425 [Desulfovibrionales bacterium]|nr:hypothetical protein [Desulfovibrionales bacterium]